WHSSTQILLSAGLVGPAIVRDLYLGGTRGTFRAAAPEHASEHRTSCRQSSVGRFGDAGPRRRRALLWRTVRLDLSNHSYRRFAICGGAGRWASGRRAVPEADSE